jgi:hypothetical protein
LAAPIGGADHSRHGVDHLRQPVSAVTQKFLPLLLHILKLFGEGVSTAADEFLPGSYLEKVACPGDEFLVVDRRLNKVGGAGFQSFETEGAVIVGGNDDDRHVHPVGEGPDLLGEGRAGHLRHLVVGDDEIRNLRTDPFQRWIGCGKGFDLDILAEGAR